MRYYLTAYSFCDTAYQLLRTYPFFLDGDTVYLTYIFCTEYLHTSDIFPGHTISHAKVQNNSDTHGN